MTYLEKIEAALRARVNSLVLSPPLPIAWYQNPVTPPSPLSAYLKVEHFRNRGERITIKGSLPHRRLGILQITVVAPLNVGDTGAAIAGLVAEHFPADLVLDYDGISVRIQKTDIMTATKEAASWDTPVSIEHECFA